MSVGKYSEHAFQALDYILDEASKYGVRLLLTLVNNWDNADSKTQVTALLKQSFASIVQQSLTCVLFPVPAPKLGATCLSTATLVPQMF